MPEVLFWTGGTWAQQRVRYITSKISLRALSRETGIPYSTLWYVRQGERQLPGIYRAELENAYRRYVYRSLREVGVSVEEARLFRYMSPSMVVSIEARMRTLADILTAGAYANQARRLEKEGISYDETELWKQARESVEQGLRKSKKPIDEKERYIEEKYLLR